MKILIVLAASAALSACGHSARQISPAFPQHDAPRAPISGDHLITVTDREIDVPHQPLAVLRTQTYRREVLEIEGVAELRAQAAQLGADAVIGVQAHPELIEEIGYRPGALLRAGSRWVTVYSLSGTAVVIEGDAPPEPLPGFNLPPLP